jgi:putative ABC transport system permease protein
VEDIGSPAVAYVPYGAYARLTHTEGMTDTIRISLWNREKSAAMVKTREIEAAIGLSGASVISTVPVSLLRNAIAEHMAVLVGALLAMAILMAVVGTCGLMSTMSMNLIERTRELGVMRAIGATPAAVSRLVIFEGLICAAFSLVFAFAFSVPLSAYLGRLIGNMAFRIPLPLVLAPLAFVAWTVLIMAGSIVASAYPAIRANRLTIRDALAYY